MIFIASAWAFFTSTLEAAEVEPPTPLACKAATISSRFATDPPVAPTFGGA